MRSLGARVVMCFLLAGAIGVRGAGASEWARFAIVSPTAPMSAGHICYTDGLGIACDATAPLMSGLGTGLGDRITSGTSSVFVAQDSAVSVTIGGSNVANFGTGGLGITNINASGAISATGTGYFGGNVGIGTDSPAAPLHVSGTSRVAYFGYGGNNITQYIAVRDTSGIAMGLDSDLGGSTGAALIQSGSNKGLGFVVNNPTFGISNSPSIYINAFSTNVGINTTSPTATLQVSGTFIVSMTGQNTTPSLYVASSGDVGIGTSAPAIALDVNGTIRSRNFIDISKTNTQEYRWNGGAGTQWRAISTINGTTNGYMIFQNTTDNFGSSFNNSIALATNGSVGIATTNPTTKLEVVGTASATNVAAVSVTTAGIKLTSATTASAQCTTDADLGVIRFNGTRAEICSPYPN